MNIFGKRSNLPLIFSRTSDRKKEKSVVSFTHDQSIICSQTQLDGIAYDQTIICRQLFADHLVDFRPMRKTEKFAWNDNYLYFSLTQVSGGEPREWGCIQQWFWRLYLWSIFWGISCVFFFFSTVLFLYWFGGPFICCSLHCFSVCRVSHDATGEADF